MIVIGRGKWLLFKVSSFKSLLEESTYPNTLHEIKIRFMMWKLFLVELCGILAVNNSDCHLSASLLPNFLCSYNFPLKFIFLFCLTQIIAWPAKRDGTYTEYSPKLDSWSLPSSDLIWFSFINCAQIPTVWVFPAWVTHELAIVRMIPAPNF